MKKYYSKMNFSVLIKYALRLLTITALPSSRIDAQVSFPLKLSSNNRYLVDQSDQPFLINDTSSWALGTAVPSIEEFSEERKL